MLTCFPKPFSGEEKIIVWQSVFHSERGKLASCEKVCGRMVIQLVIRWHHQFALSHRFNQTSIESCLMSCQTIGPPILIFSLLAAAPQHFIQEIKFICQPQLEQIHLISESHVSIDLPSLIIQWSSLGIVILQQLLASDDGG